MKKKKLNILQQEIGVVAEAAGRTLRREHPLTHEELTELRDALNYCAKTVQNIRDTNAK